MKRRQSLGTFAMGRWDYDGYAGRSGAAIRAHPGTDFSVATGVCLGRCRVTDGVELCTVGR